MSKTNAKKKEAVTKNHDVPTSCYICINNRTYTVSAYVLLCVYNARTVDVFFFLYN